MPRFSKHFNLGLSQHELDFVDVNNQRDTPVYVDPYAIEIKDDVWAEEASNCIRTFFKAVLQSLRDGDDHRSANLMSHLHEPRETFLGVSRGTPKGKGVGSIQSKKLLKRIKDSNAYSTGLLTDLSEMALYVEHVDRDKISDLTTNIIRRLLVEYTISQCDLHGISVSNYIGPPLWNNERRNWTADNVSLPYIGKSPVLLVPKYIVRRRLSLDSQEFYNKQITDFLVSENLKANSSLVQTIIRKGIEHKKVYKGDVRRANPKSKSLIAKIALEHPEILELYKEIAATHEPMSNFQDDLPSVPTVCKGLASTLQTIAPGKQNADIYHRTALGALTVLFYPRLTQPHKEWKINGGRKRIDIVFTNAANTGFFAQKRDNNTTNANVVIVECKNYTDDVANEELDQLAGRFDNNRGRFGLLMCRNIKNRERVLQQCRDFAHQSIGFIIVLTDADLIQLLQSKAQLNDTAIEAILHRKFRELLQ